MLIASSHLPAKEAGPGILVMMDLHMWTLMMDFSQSELSLSLLLSKVCAKRG